MISFGICMKPGWCNRGEEEMLEKCVDSFAQVPDYQLVIVKDDESLGRKLNIVVERSDHLNICFIRSYNFLYPGWWNAWNKFGWNWDVGMNRVLNKDGSRYRDLVAWDDPQFPPAWQQVDKPWPLGKFRNGRPHIVPYEYSRKEYCYVSGMYFLAKKKFMESVPFRNDLDWGQSEDVEWSDRARKLWKYEVNTEAKTGMQIQKDAIIPVATDCFC